MKYEDDTDLEEQDVADRREAVALFGQPRPSTPQLWVNPYLCLLEEVARTQAQVVFLQVEVDQYDNPAAGGRGAHHSPVGRRALTRWTQERDRLINVSTKAISMGIAERHLKLAQLQGEQLAKAFLRAADQLGLTNDQRRALPDLVRTALHELQAENSDVRSLVV